MAATPHYINDATLLILKLKDENGDDIDNLAAFDNIKFWLQNNNGSKVLKEYSISEGTAVITASGDKVKIVIEEGDLQDAAIRLLTLYVKYYFTKTDADLGDIPLSKSIKYNLFKLLTHAKSYTV